MIWSQTLRGRAFDLLAPRPEMVDFAEIADTLATLHRYAGAAEKPVSVALHTLIACDAAPRESDKAHILVHDAHEAFIGDIITPAAHAIHEIIRLRAGYKDAENFSDALAALKANIDAAILSAAGLLPPDHLQAAGVKFADLTALVTERRDFLAKPPMPWAPQIEAIKPLPKKYRLRPAPDVAAELLARFKVYLPALRAHAA
jgi:uncharacterized protein